MASGEKRKGTDTKKKLNFLFIKFCFECNNFFSSFPTIPPHRSASHQCLYLVSQSSGFYGPGSFSCQPVSDHNIVIVNPMEGERRERERISDGVSKHR